MLRRPIRGWRLGSWLLACTCVLSTQGAQAGGLRVEPVSVVIEERSSILQLGNVADAPLNAQLRVYRWTQDGEGEHLTPTDSLWASPPLMAIEPGNRQIVRLVLEDPAGLPAGVCEAAYRLVVDELPASEPVPRRGLRYAMSYSIPAFVHSRSCKEPAPTLSWRIDGDGEHARLTVANAGTMHAQLAAVSFVDDAGNRTEISPGLFGYVLAGAQMSFALAPPAAVFARGGQLEVMVNGARVAQTLPPPAASE